MTITEILAHYKTQSQDPEYTQYSPLFCAIYEGDLDHVQQLLAHYQHKNTLQEQLSFIGPETKENILQVAMKHPPIIELCCKTIQDTNAELFTQLIEHTDVDQDTVFHQIVEFGRDESLKALKPYLKAHVDEAVLNEVYAKKNKYEETASDILENYDGSVTIRNLAVKPEIKTQAQKNVGKVQEVFESLDLQHSHKFGM